MRKTKMHLFKTFRPKLEKVQSDCSVQLSQKPSLGRLTDNTSRVPLDWSLDPVMPQAQPARPQAQPARPQAQPAKPQPTS